MTYVPYYRSDAELAPRDYEEACRIATLRSFDGAGHASLLRMQGLTLRDVALDGEYPATAVVVVIDDPPQRKVRTRTHRYPVWGDPTLHMISDQLQVPSPELFGVNVAGWVLEG